MNVTYYQNNIWFILVINFEKSYLHKYVDRNERSSVTAKPLRTLD